MPKSLLLVLALSVVTITTLATLYINQSEEEQVPKSETETAINQANFLYDQKKEAGMDFSKGPCLSNALLPGWVLDIVHSPRQELDDLPENMCPAFLEGRATHFVELDPDGNLVRVK